MRKSSSATIDAVEQPQDPSNCFTLGRRLLIDRRDAARPTSTFVGCMVDFFRAHEARLAGTRAAVLVSSDVPEPLPDLRVGRFRIRTFDDAAKAVQWLDQDWDNT